jgi:hypothetical protein
MNFNLLKPGAIIAVLAGALLLTACGEEPSDPEQQVREAIARAETAAEAGELSALKALVANDYQDSRGYNRQSIIRLLQFYLLGHQSIHILSRVSEVSINEDGTARAVVYAAMTGQPVKDAQALLNIRADFHRFDLTLRNQGVDEWRVTRANWRRAQAADFL